ncbi:LysR family transcriptional regulator [Shewanella japonica]|uniref:LysR family transcriptional regulator n=1 Tax=Shewanella japonica TaxID=93973 RepID=A0ABN4YKW1_9GAMM|nr:LysR family transcriptional regulator [Shewanella japonica]ARD24114.1 LysR family transcriptional regulator [Shewanella japonica]
MKTEDISLFHRIVETGSLVEAADILNLPKSTLSRRLQALEDELSVKLFHRQSRSMTLTASGSHFYDKTTSMMSSLEETLSELTNEKTDVGGHLRILVFPIPELLQITQGILHFMDLHPSITVEIIVSAEPQDMIRNNIDLAFILEDSFNENEMVARHIMSETVHFFASPEYLARAGTPQTPEEISDHNSILFRYPNGRIFNEVPFGQDMVLSVKGNLCVNNLSVCLEATLAGAGIAMMPLPFCQDYVKTGQLEMLFKDSAPYEGKCYLVYPSRRYISLASQRFIDHMLIELENCSQTGTCNQIAKIRGAIKPLI